MNKLTYVKPSGLEITINDRPENIQYAKSLGWTLKGEKQKVETPKENPDPGQTGKGVKMKIPDGTGTTLYKRVEGMKPGDEVEIKSDLFPNELVAKRLKEGWFKTKEAAENAPPDKKVN